MEMSNKPKTYTLFTRFQLPPDTDPDVIRAGVRMAVKHEEGEFTGLGGGVDVVVRSEN
jgi:hypothetical protein